MIKLLKASAGSGKTYRLAKTYIGMLLGSKDEHAYRHILAVTFTNKATDEMKRRILKELDQLALEPEKSPYYSDFISSFPSAKALADRAGKILTAMLHDYGAFAVSTIDKFVQTTLKAFAREIGQFASYQVELDRDSLVRESVDRILDSLSNGDSLLKWLTDRAMAGLNEDGKFSIEGGLYEMAKSLKSDAHREAMGESDYSMYSSDRLSNVRKECAAVKNEYENRLKATQAALQKAFDDAGVSPEDTTRKFASSLIKYSLNNEKGEKPAPTSLANCLNSDNWFPQRNRSYLNPFVISKLSGPLADFAGLFDKKYNLYRTACILLGQVYNLGIAERLYGEFDSLMKEKNVLAIDESNTLLKKIIDGSDAPFVYEKIGVRFEDFLLDEFQDTSRIQWENFEPLLKESNSSRRDNLVVGDVKQSIYRFRSSDWNLLASGVKQAFGDSADDGEALTENWRSTGQVVEFNNKFFCFARRELDTMLGVTDSEEGFIAPIYSDVVQTARTGDPQKGSVELTWCPEAPEGSIDSDPVLPAVLSSINKALKAGASLSQIAVLVRWNSEGSKVASYLGANGIAVVSNDSLRVKSSLTVRRLTSLLAYNAGGDEGKPLDRYVAKSTGIIGKRSYYSIPDLCESLLRDLKKFDTATYEKETFYIQSFMDEIKLWTSKNGNKLASFLKYWEDSDKKIASPDGIDAVNVLTIHKAKGLEFPYVIFPYPEKVRLYDSEKTKRWCRLPKGSGLPVSEDVVWEVTLSGKSTDTLFAEEYRKERELQFTDNLNIVYVALTRASKALHVISTQKTAKPSSSKELSKRFGNFSQLLYAFAREQSPYLPDLSQGYSNLAVSVLYGQSYDFSSYTDDMRGTSNAVESYYESFPLNTAEEGKTRLKLRADASDFFDDEGHTGYGASRRIRGTVLHDILSEVVVPSDLDGAVRRAVAAGRLSGEEAAEAEGLLRGAIKSVSDRGWFPSSREGVRNEEAIITSSGEVRRPDRVVDLADRTVIIDYKFGHPERAYYTQLREYASLYGQMFPTRPVEAWLWYLTEPDPSKSCVQVIS